MMLKRTRKTLMLALKPLKTDLTLSRTSNWHQLLLNQVTYKQQFRTMLTALEATLGKLTWPEKCTNMTMASLFMVSAWKAMTTAPE